MLTFTDASEDDLGLYMVEKSDEPELSDSFNFTAEGKVNCAKYMCPCREVPEKIIDFS